MTSAAVHGDAATIIAQVIDRGASSGEPDPPPWATDLHALFTPGPETPAVAPFTLGDIIPRETRDALGLAAADAWPLHGVFEPLLRVAARRLASVAPLSPGVARDMLMQLARRWSATAAPLLVHRIDAADVLAGVDGEIGATLRAAVFGDGRPPSEQWLTVLDGFPVLGRLFAVAYRQWIDSIAELMTRLNADSPRLERALAGGAPLGALVAYRADAGDAHDHGRSVTILTFASGVRTVYKPKDLRVARIYMDLVRCLNASGLSPRLHERAILTGDGYAWEAFVEPAPCANTAEVRRFYQRMGMHARLIQLLDGVDFTTDNVIAHGEWPVLIDLEMLLSPRMPPEPPASATAREVHRRSWDSPHRSGLITAKIMGDAGRRPAEMGALGRSDQRVAPFKQGIMRRDAEGAAAIVRDYAPFSQSAASPVLHDAPVCAEPYFDDVVRGYRAMQRCLRRMAPRLSVCGGILDRLGRSRVRFLCRDTHVYARLLQESCHPSRLRDGAARETCLERLWRARFADPAVVQSEVDALRDLDVPLFTARADTDALGVRGGADVARFFDGSPIATVRARLAALPTRIRPRDLDAIRTVLFTLAPHATRSARPQGKPDVAPFAPLDLARAIGDALLRERVSVGDGDVAWLGVNYHPPSDSWELGVLSDDLVSGTAGLAVLFADLYRVSGARRFGAIAHTMAIGIRDRLRISSSAGWLYAGMRVAHALGDAALEREISAPIAALSPASLARCDGCDMVGGLAGLLHALLRTDAFWPHTCAVGHALLERRGSDGTFPMMTTPSDATTLDAIPDAQSGAVLALLRLAACPMLPRFELSTAERASLIDSIDTTGSPGAILAQVACAAIEPRVRPHAFRNADRFLGAPSDAVSAAEVALATGDRDRALAWAALLAHTRRRFGSWFPDSWCADRYRPSVILGAGAVAHLMLRLVDPRIASVRLMA